MAQKGGRIWGCSLCERAVDRDAIEAALRIEFLDGARNNVLVAPQGLGKTLIARNNALEQERSFRGRARAA